MDVFVARQPIFDTTEQVVGYELLHRVDATNSYDGTDAVAATGQLLSDHLLTDSWDLLTGGRRAWVNFPAALLLSGAAQLVPPKRLVVELLEDIAVDADVVDACRRLADCGYTLAADDVVDADDDNPLLDLVDVVKVDFRAASGAARRELADRFRGRARLLAEKVETRADLATAVELGYDLLQGYVLRQPAVVSRGAIDQSRLGLLAVVAAVARRPMDVDEVAGAIKGDVALTDRFLRYLNSAAFGWRDRVETIGQGLVRLGEVQIRRWTTINALSAVNPDNPDEVVVATLVRAHLCEQLADLLPWDLSAFELFLTGIYSRIDVLLGTDLATAVRQAPVPPAVRHALLERDGPLWRTLQLVTAWEDGDWASVVATTDELRVDRGEVARCYTEAIANADAASVHRSPESV